MHRRMLGSALAGLGLFFLGAMPATGQSSVDALWGKYSRLAEARYRNEQYCIQHRIEPGYECALQRFQLLTQPVEELMREFHDLHQQGISEPPQATLQRANSVDDMWCRMKNDLRYVCGLEKIGTAQIKLCEDVTNVQEAIVEQASVQQTKIQNPQKTKVVPDSTSRNYNEFRSAFDITYTGRTNTIYTYLVYPKTVYLGREWPITLRFEIPDLYDSWDFLSRGSLNVGIDDVAGAFDEKEKIRIKNNATGRWESPVRSVDPSFFEQHGTDYFESMAVSLIPSFGVSAFEILRELSPRYRGIPKEFADDATYDVRAVPFIGISLPFAQPKQEAGAVEITVPVVWATKPTHDVFLYLESFVSLNIDPTERPPISRAYRLHVNEDGTVNAGVYR
jgi:hypothetical protein